MRDRCHHRSIGTNYTPLPLIFSRRCLAPHLRLEATQVNCSRFIICIHRTKNKKSLDFDTSQSHGFRHAPFTGKIRIYSLERHKNKFSKIEIEASSKVPNTRVVLCLPFCVWVGVMTRRPPWRPWPLCPGGEQWSCAGGGGDEVMSEGERINAKTTFCG